MSDDLEARCHHAITHDGEAYIKLADASVTFSLYRKDIATKAARIAELEAALQDMAKHVWRGDWDKLKPETQKVLKK